MMKITETSKVKTLSSPKYNYVFNKENGMFARWGESQEDDPEFSPVGPEILDIEISTSVHNPNEEEVIYDGGCAGRCSFCYKSNGDYPTYNMTFDEFKNIFDKMGKQLTQIAFGIMNINTNPDFFKMAEYSRENGVIPNFTMHPYENISESRAKEIARIFGAVAISYYNKKSVLKCSKALYDAGMRQINIHVMLSEETFGGALILIKEFKKNPKFHTINSIVFLSLKQKGGGVNYNPLSKEKYKLLVDTAMEYGVPIGFDSCSAHKFLSSVKECKQYSTFEMLAEPCESACFSGYVNAYGEFHPCSFTEGTKEWEEGISVLNNKNFLKDVWFHPKVQNMRSNLLKNNRHCPYYKI